MESKRKLFIVIVLVIAVFSLYQIFDFGDTSDGASTMNQEEETFEILVNTLNTDVLKLADHEVIGLYFVHPESGLTFYVTDGECIGDCLVKWPPYTALEAMEEEGNIGTILRSDTGEHQYTWKGQGLYAFSDDEFPNDVLGDGFNNVWKIARP